MHFKIQKEGKLHPGNITPRTGPGSRMFNCQTFLETQLPGNVILAAPETEGVYLGP